MSAIVLHKQDLSELQVLAAVLAESGFFKDARTEAQAAAKVLAGRELGLGPVEAMRGFHVIEGKIEMSADLLAQRVKQHPDYDYRVRSLSPEGCAIEFFEQLEGHERESLGTSEFTRADAEAAGLWGKKGPWSTYPKNMLFARAMSNGVAWFCPDVSSGARIYVDGEIGDDRFIDVDEALEKGSSVVDVEAVEQQHDDDTTTTEHNGETLVVDVVTGEVVEGEPDPSAQVEGSSAELSGDDDRGSEEPSTAKQRQKLAMLAQRFEWDDDRRRAEAGVASFTDLTKSDASRLIEVWTGLAEGDPEAVESPGQGDGAAAAEAEDSSAAAPEPATPEQYNRLLKHYKNKRAIIQAIRARFGDETDYLKLTTEQATALLEAVMA